MNGPDRGDDDAFGGGGGGPPFRASRKLRVPLTTVSRRISDLEAHLKTQLLNRTSRRVILTDAAESYLQACRRILDDVDEAERVVSGEYRAPQGELTVTQWCSAAYMWCRSQPRS